MSKVFCLKVWLFALGAIFCVFAHVPEASAQTIFCPSSVTSSNGTPTTGIALTKGACTNPTKFSDPKNVDSGAFSGAALAGQAVGNLAQAMTNVETVTATQSIETRRITEAATCPPGQSFVDGLCRPTTSPLRPAPAPVAAPAPRVTPPASTVASAPTKAPPHVRKTKTLPHLRTASAPRRRVAETPVFIPPPVEAPILVINQAHYGAWAQGFGDYEERDGKSSYTLQCCSTAPPVGLNLEASSKTTTAGFLGGIDWTKRDLVYGGDGLILGVMAGYMSSDVKVSASAISTVPPVNSTSTGVANGFGTLRAHLSGPSLGLYATYFNGPWSNDFMIKNDFLDLDESFTDLQAYQVCKCAPGNFIPFTNAFAGSGKASLNELTLADNLNYKIPLVARLWMEPTAGVQYTLSSYSGGAAALGLKDGDLVRLQAGTRFGIDGALGDTHVTTTLTGLAYDDVLVDGNFIQGGVFGTTSNILNDEGKLRGEGILAVKFDFGGGKSAFLQGDVRGGDHLFGAGGKGGFRVEW